MPICLICQRNYPTLFGKKTCASCEKAREDRLMPSDVTPVFGMRSAVAARPATELPSPRLTHQVLPPPFIRSVPVLGRPFIDEDDIFRFFGPNPDNLIIDVDSTFLRSVADYMRSIDCERRVLTSRLPMLRWIRDPLITTSRGPSIRNVNAAEALESTAVSKGMYAKYAHFIRKEVILSAVPRALEPEEIQRFNEFVQRNPIENPIGTHNIDIAGGNIIKAINAHGQLMYIVGITGVLATLEQYWRFLDQFAVQFPGLSPRQKEKIAGLSAEDQEFYRKFQTVKQLIRQFLNPSVEGTDGNRNVIFVDSYSYHLDLDMLYFCPGTIFVNSYQKVYQIARKYSREHPEDSVLTPFVAWNSWCAEHTQATFERIIGQLTHHGFRVIPIAGSSFYMRAQEDDPLGDRTDPHKSTRGETPLFPSELKNYFCFLNCIAVKFSASDNRVDLLVPADPEYMSDFQRRYWVQFQSAVRSTNQIRNIICIRAYSSDRMARETPLAYLMKFMGGLRCSVNKVKTNATEFFTQRLGQ